MIHWVALPPPSRLGIMPRPRGGDWLEDEMRRLSAEGATVLVSLLEDAEIAELDLAAEPALAERAGLTFLALPLPDRAVPTDSRAFRDFVARVAAQLDAGAAVAIHCRAGIGRSSMLAASVLALRGVAVAEAFRLLSECRGLSVPDTEEQRAWVELHSGGQSHRGPP